MQRITAPYGKDWNDTLKYCVEKNVSCYAFTPHDAAASANVPLEDSAVGGHVVHQIKNPSLRPA